MNLNSLKDIKFDLKALKNISIADIRNFINEQQVLSLNIAIGLSALFAAVVVLNAQFQEYSKLKLRLNELTVKEEPARAYDKILKRTGDFMQEIPAALSEEDVIPYLTQITNRHHIVIKELQPPYTTTEGFYREVRVSFVCSVTDFHEALVFINDLENSKYMIKVNSWSFVPQKTGRDADDPRLKPGLLMSLDISSMRLMKK
jgi:hypothetical protein